jgi:hypothetical protein
MNHRGDKYKRKYNELKQRFFNQHGGNGELIKLAWESIIKVTCDVRKNNKNLDGLKFWNVIKSILTKIEPIEGTEPVWNSKHKKIIEFVKQIGLKEFEEGDKLLEPNHFFLQQMNIPTKDNGKPSFHRLMQIALNIGQGMARPPPITPEQFEKTRKLKMNHISSYMKPEEYEKYDFKREDLLNLIISLTQLSANPPLVETDESDGSGGSGASKI